MASTYLSFSSSPLHSPFQENPQRPILKQTHHVRICSAYAAPGRKKFASPPSSDKRQWKRGDSPGFKERSAESDRRTPFKRHWNQEESPGRGTDRNFSDNSNRRRTPLNNVHKKLEQRKPSPKAWVEPVAEAFSDTMAKKQWREALEVFEMLKEQPFYQPKEGTYMKLLGLLGRSGQPDRARQLFDEMIEAGFGPTPEQYTALLAAYCRNKLIDKAFSVLTHMKSLPNCQPDVYTYSILIKACVDASRYDLVESLDKEMAERSIMPNTVTRTTVLSGYGKAGKFDELETLLSSMFDTTDCKPNVWTMNVVLTIFGNDGQIDAMERSYEKFRSSGIEPETRTFNILIGAYGKKRMYDKMTSVMEFMRKLELPWTSSTFNNVIEAFADVGDVQNMEYTFDQMCAENMRPDTYTFCCLMDGYANAGMFHKVIATVKLAGKFEISENTSFFNAIISACAKAEDLMEMERVFQRMKDQQCLPNSATFSVMMEAYRKEGMNDKVYDLEQEREQNPIISSDAELSGTEMDYQHL